MSEAETLLSALEPLEEAVLRTVRSVEDCCTSWHKYPSSFDTALGWLFDVVDRIKAELQNRLPLSSKEETWSWLNFDCDSHIMSHDPHIGIWEFATSNKLHAAAESSSSKSGSLTSLVFFIAV